MKKAEKKQPLRGTKGWLKANLSQTELKVVCLISAATAKGKMISEIALVSIAYFKENIQPFQTLEAVRKLLREGFVYQPRDDCYKRV